MIGSPGLAAQDPMISPDGLAKNQPGAVGAHVLEDGRVEISGGLIMEAHSEMPQSGPIVKWLRVRGGWI
jgi:hypothetical protein